MVHLQASYDLKTICLKETALKDLIDGIKGIRSLPSGHNRRFNGVRNELPLELKLVLTYPYYSGNFYPVALNGKILKLVAEKSSYNDCLDIMKLINFMKEVANSKNKSSLSKQHKEQLLGIIPKWIAKFDDKDLNVVTDWLKGKGKIGAKKSDLIFIYETSKDRFDKQPASDLRKDVIIK